MKYPLSDSYKPVTVPVSFGYRAVIAWRNRRFDRGAGVTRMPVPVISVGNITTGGAGKTPMVAHLARRLLELNRKPIIALRGYKQRSEQFSDEQMEHQDRLPDVAVIADPDRSTALKKYLQRNPGVDCVILDDGFQHRQLHRDLDLVLIDATRDILGDRLLPVGNLREPQANLKRAHAVIITRAGQIDDELSDWICHHHGKQPLVWSRHEWTGLCVYDKTGQCVETKGIDTIRGLRVGTMFGVGHPDSVRQQLADAGANIVTNIPVRDHQHYDRSLLEKFKQRCAGIEALVVTSKDWVKLQSLIHFLDWSIPIIVPQLELILWQGEEELEALVRRTLKIQPQ